MTHLLLGQALDLSRYTANKKNLMKLEISTILSNFNINRYWIFETRANSSQIRCRAKLYQMYNILFLTEQKSSSLGLLFFMSKTK